MGVVRRLRQLGRHDHLRLSIDRDPGSTSFPNTLFPEGSSRGARLPSNMTVTTGTCRALPDRLLSAASRVYRFFAGLPGAFGVPLAGAPLAPPAASDLPLSVFAPSRYFSATGRAGSFD